jgi:hypothetical protein
MLNLNAKLSLIVSVAFDQGQPFCVAVAVAIPLRDRPRR